VSSPVNAVSSSFTTVDLETERVQRNEFESMFGQDKDANGNRIFTPISASVSSYVNLGGSIPVNVATLPNADFNNLELTTVVSPIPTTRIHKDYPKEQIIWDPLSALQTRRMIKTSQEHAMMDVNNAFLYGTIKEEVYVCQPPGFEDLHFPNMVYKAENALYGLHQALRAWYETLSTYLLENRFRRGIIDKTLFIKKDNDDIMLVQVCIDDIIFGSTKKSLCTEFEGLMHKKFQMSSMGELTFFLGLQVMQKDDGIFISQDKDSPFDLEPFSDSDYAGASFDKKSTTRGCQFLGKRLISWQCKKQTVVANLTTEAEYVVAANCHGQLLLIQNQMLDYGFNFMNNKIYIDNESTICIVKNPVYHQKTKHIEIRHHFIKDSYEKGLIQFWASVNVKNVNGEVHIQALVDKNKVIITEVSIRRDLRFEDEGGIDCLSNEVIFEQLTLLGAKTTTWNDFRSIMASAIICLSTNQKFNFSKYIFDNMVLDLEEAKTAQAKEIARLKKSVMKLEQKRKSRTSRIKRLRKVGTAMRVESLTEASLGRINEEDMFGVNDLDGDEVVVDVEKSVKVVEKEVSTANPVTTVSEVITTTCIEVFTAATTQISKVELTLAQILIEFKATKPKATTTTATTVTAAGIRPKEKRIVMQEPSKTHQIMDDEEFAKNLEAQMQAELEEDEERLARLKEEETNIALIES
nr:retrotransposon protein, putative, unclassified [Tanacetum cinerariifolium]